MARLRGPSWVGGRILSGSSSSKGFFRGGIGFSACLALIPAVILPVSASAQALFRASEAFSYDSAPATELAVADLDLDGHLDAVVAGETATPARVHVFLGRPGSTFAAPLPFPAKSSIVALAVDRIDADPYPDVVTVNSRSSTVSLYLNSGDGTMRSPVDYRMGSDARSLGLGDFVPVRSVVVRLERLGRTAV